MIYDNLIKSQFVIGNPDCCLPHKQPLRRSAAKAIK